MTRTLLLLFGIGLLAGCSAPTSGTVAADVIRLYPGCQLDRLSQTRKLDAQGEQVLAKFTYTCKNETQLRYGNLVYSKGMDTGFTMFCCAREAKPEEI
ncbi:MAG: hypothetical protein HOQ32_00375 [Lysobacter sp.]|nr:hypothetical protein [Lysobacter sp.]